jgi:hypothetical protein
MQQTRDLSANKFHAKLCHRGFGRVEIEHPLPFEDLRPIPSLSTTSSAHRILLLGGRSARNLKTGSEVLVLP